VGERKSMEITHVERILMEARSGWSRCKTMLGYEGNPR